MDTIDNNMDLRERLIIAPNREPYVRRKGKLEKTSGGLVSALDPIMQKNGGIWIRQVREKAARLKRSGE